MRDSSMKKQLQEVLEFVSERTERNFRAVADSTD
jgi:hypothetical protein